MNILSTSFLILSLVIACLLSSCIEQKKTMLPPGNVEEVNSPKNEFAPVFHPLTKDSLMYITSNQRGNEVLHKYVKKENKFNPSEEATTPLLPSLYDKISSNDGTVAFFSNKFGDPISNKRGFIASTFDMYSRFPNQEKIKFNKELYHIGGTDLYEFSELSGTMSITNYGIPLNSEFWDSQPTVAQSGDTAFVVFASDRPSNGIGFSNPFERTIEKDSMIMNSKGNSDLYYAFGINGTWVVKNFSDVLGNITVNTDSNEYSPFLYCVENKFCSSAQPATLLYSSKTSGDFQIHEADIVIDFSRQQVIVDNVNVLSTPINSTSDDYFPFVPLPHTNEINSIYLSSDRFSQKGGQYESKGGFDIYKFQYSKPCRAPQIQYSVVFVDETNPMEAPLGPFEVTLKNSIGEIIQSNSTNPSTFTLECGTKYSVSAKSLHDKIECTPGVRTISHYASKKIVHGYPIVTSKEMLRTIDTVEGAKITYSFDSIFTISKLGIAEGEKFKSKPESIVFSIEFEKDSVMVTELRIKKNEHILGGKRIQLKRKELVYDSIPTVDTIYFPVYKEPILSKLSMNKGYFELYPAHDSTIIDTIYLLPQYYNFPPCKWEFSRNIIDEYRKNVPYFQTGFWEVNTSKNFQDHKKLLASKEFNDASFIELQNENKYFGIKGVPPEFKRSRTIKRNRRIQEYQEFAKAVDRNLNDMVEELGNGIIPLFLDIKARTPGGSSERLIVQIQAYSDKRPIDKGTYIGEPVKFTEGEYNPTDKSFSISSVNIENNASLIGENNEVLSRLRVYYGYKEVLSRLLDSSKYNYLAELHKSGKLLLPDDVSNKEEFEKKLLKAEIVIIAKGKYYDENVVSKVKGYVGKEGDFKAYDDVRRVDLRVDRIEIVGGKIVKPDCCVETPLPLIDPKNPQFTPIR